jgi:hypothetical protein
MMTNSYYLLAWLFGILLIKNGDKIKYFIDFSKL